MATADEYAAWIVANKDKQGTPEFATVAAAYQDAKAHSAKAHDVPSAADNFDPSAGGGSLSIGPFDTGISTPQWLDRTLAGAGKAFADTGSRIKQLATFNGNQAEIDARQAGDAPLMRTGAGVTGNILGNLATMIGPSAAVGAAGKAAQLPMLMNAAKAFMLPKSILGAAGQGAAMGALQPVTSDESTLKNIAMGGAAGAVIPAAITGFGLAKNIVSPFFKSGQQQLAGSALERFAANPNSINNPQFAQQLVAGSKPNIAEATGDPGLAQMVRSLRNNPDANVPLTALDSANRSARLTALQDIAGNPADRAAWVQARKDVTGPLYDQALAEVPEMTPWLKGQITQLMKRPTINAAFQDGKRIALDDGLKLNPDNAAQVFHYTKLALDQKISGLADNPAAQKAAMNARDLLLTTMESKNFAPSYRAARSTYADMSKPINQIDVGQALVNKFQPALADFGADTRTTAATYANALRNGDMTAQQATGFKGARLADILGPQQMQTVTGIAQDLGRQAKSAELGAARGSPTMQNFAGNDILRGIFGPLGLPQKWIEAALPQQILGASKVAYSVPDKRVLGLLGEAAADPQLAKQFLALAHKRGIQEAMRQYSPYAIAPVNAGLLGMQSSQ